MTSTKILLTFMMLLIFSTPSIAQSDCKDSLQKAMKHGKVLSDAYQKAYELAEVRAETIKVLESGISKLRNDLEGAISYSKNLEAKLQASERKRKRQRKTAIITGIVGIIIGIFI